MKSDFAHNAPQGHTPSNIVGGATIPYARNSGTRHFSPFQHQNFIPSSTQAASFITKTSYVRIPIGAIGTQMVT